MEERYWEFFAATLRNRNTRRAYLRAVTDFYLFLEAHPAVTLAEIRPLHASAHVEALTHSHAPATVEQRLAAIRALLDWMTVGQAIPSNPAAWVRGPRHVVRRGSTPVLAREDARRLLESLRTDTVVGLRDRALLALMIYSFARVGAAVTMRVEDFRPTGRRWSIGSERRAVSRTKFRPTTIWRPGCTTTSKLRESQTILGAGCSGQLRGGQAA